MSLLTSHCGTMSLVAGCVCLLLLNRAAFAANILQEVYSWKTFNFTYPSWDAYQAAIESEEFIPTNVYPIDVETSLKDPKCRVFITTPHLLAGVPATLSTVDSSTSATSPNLAPYPDWSWYQKEDCSGITSVFRTQIDMCGRLWVPDCGIVGIMTIPKRKCPPKLLWFELAKDILIDEYVLPEETLGANSRILTIAVDVLSDSNSCENTFVYLADGLAFNLIVYDAKNRNSWVITSNYFYPYPLAGSFKVAGVDFDNMDGILGLALSPETHGDRKLYFHSLASYRESWVRTSYLQNQSFILSEQSSKYGLFHVSKSERPSQTAPSSMNDDGILFFSFLSYNSLNCWNSRTEYSKNNLIELDRDNEAMQFVSGLKIIRNKSNVDEVWLISCRFQRLMAGFLNPQETNFYILKAPIPELLGNHQCKPHP